MCYLVYFLLAPTLLWASVGKIAITPENTSVKFLAVGSPSAIKISGTMKKEEKSVDGQLTLDADQITGHAKVILETLDTGIDLRTKHMKEKYLETAKYPHVELSKIKITLPVSIRNADFKAKELPFEAVISLHGVSNPIRGNVSVERKGTNLSMQYEFKVRLSDFKIETPTFLNISVTNDVVSMVDVNGTIQ